MQRRTGRALAASLLCACALVPTVSRAATGVMFSADNTFPPEYTVTAASVVNDGGNCDYVTVVISGVGGITDIDYVCIDVATRTGTNLVDPGSFEGGYEAPGFPLTYQVYDTVQGDICNSDENSQLCLTYLQSRPLLFPGAAPNAESIPVAAAPVLAALSLLLAALGSVALRRRR
jgi:hypothetical protein